MDEAMLSEQVEYYRHRAGEYDDFWSRTGQYVLPADLREDWRADASEAVSAVLEWAPAGGVLELACGTGLWTQHLAKRALFVKAIDAAPEMLAISRKRLDDDQSSRGTRRRVTYVEADVFSTWQPERHSYDGIFFGYWHSHIPDDRLEEFWDKLAIAIRPAGSVMLVDSSPYPKGMVGDSQARYERRTLSDGRQYGIVKRYWDPADLIQRMSSFGWDTHARTTQNGMILLAQMRHQS